MHEGKRGHWKVSFSGSFPEGKAVPSDVYVANPKDNKWFKQAKKTTKGIRTGSRPVE